MQALLPILLVLALITAAALYEASLVRHDLERNPPPGRLVDLGGYCLHLNCSGEGSPVVVLDAGLGDSSIVWASIQKQAAADTRVCSYDRAGLGWSDPGPKPRTFQRAAEELHTLLKNAGEAGPYVLVGHSAGVNTARLFAETYPEDVAGLVLIEPPIFARADPILVRVVHIMRQAVGALSRLGVIRLLGKYSLMKLLFGGVSPPAELSERAGFLYRPVSIQASIDETDALPETIDLLNRSVRPGAWRDWPVVILSAYRKEEPHPQANDPLEQLARLSTHGEVRRVRSTHFVHFEHPQLVIESINNVITATR